MSLSRTVGRPKCMSNNNEWKQRLRECGNFLCYFQYTNKSLCCHKYRPFHYSYREKEHLFLNNKKKFPLKQVSIIQKAIWCCIALYLLYLHEKHDRKRLKALHHLISLSYSHWFFVSLFIQNNSTNNSFFLGQQLTELTSIIKGDGAERKMEAHFLKDWFFFFLSQNTQA